MGRTNKRPNVTVHGVRRTESGSEAASPAGKTRAHPGEKSRPNRRQKRQESANKPRVKLRVRLLVWQARLRVALARIHRPLLWLSRALLLLLVTAGALAGGRLLEQYVRSAKAFATREVIVTGASRLSQQDVLAATGLALGKNVFEISPELARTRLVAQPWVAEATVTRRLPGTYQIEIREQQPAALLQLEATYLVSEEASVLKRVEPGDPVDLPVITGVDPAHFRSDLAFRTSLLVNAVALLHDYRDVGLWRREPISEIHAEGEETVMLYVGKDAMLVRLGERPFRKKLQRLRGILDELKHDSARPAYVYLDNVRRPDRVAVRLR
jgi:cell division protein FtsQ